MEENKVPAPHSEDGFVYNLYYWLQTLVFSVVIIVLMFTFVGRITRVVGGSMLNTLHEGDLLLLQSIGYKPKAGDIVVLNKTTDEATTLLGGDTIVKRVIATEGQSIEIDYKNSAIYVDGQLLNEPYVWEEMRPRPGSHSQQTFFIVPEDSIFVMGDNRNGSTDSRHDQLGMIHEDYVLGRAVCILFPLADIGLL